jgi:hypothetical protein
MYRLPVATVLVLLATACGEPVGEPSFRTATPYPPSLPAPPVLREISASPLFPAPDPALWPADVQSGLATLLGQRTLFIAAPGQPVDLSCVPAPGVPRERLVAAVVGPKFAVLQVEAGGFAPVNKVWVFARGSAQATLLWAQLGQPHLAPEALLPAIRSGSLWPGARPSLSAPAGT